MKAKVKSIFSVVIAWILGILGFSTANSCIRCEYGCPHTDFVLKGIVTDNQSNPLKGIRVTVQYVNPDTGQAYDQMSEAFSDETGAVNYHDSFSMIFYNEDNVYRIHLEDVDGPENGGEFEAKDIAANLVKTAKGDGHWYEGALECTFKAALDKTN